MSSSIRSFTLADRTTTKTGCRWSEQFSIFSRFLSRPASTRSPRFGDFISPPLRAIRSATGIVPLPSFGVGPIESFTLHSAASLMVGWTTGHQSRFATSPHFPSLSSLSFNGYLHHHQRVTPMTANHALQRTRHGVVVCNSRVPCAGSLSLGR